MDLTTTRLVDFALSSMHDDLSQATVIACKKSLLDSFGCAIAGFHTPLTQKVIKLSSLYSHSKTHAGIWGTNTRSSIEMAAFANGVMLRVLDFNDAYRNKSGGHPSDIISAVVAVADFKEVSGDRLLSSIVMSYEIYCQCCDAIDLNSLGWDQPLYGIVASTLGAGVLIGLNREQLGHAISLSLAPNIAMLQTRRGQLSDWKGCAGANAAKNGLFAALLASEGFTGPDAIFEGRHGLFDIVGKFYWDVPSTLTTHTRIQDVNFKNFPVCYHGQSAVWASIQIHQQINYLDIKVITVKTYQQAFIEMANEPVKWLPTTAETADHSLPFVIASTIIDGDITADSYAGNKLKDTRLHELMNKIKVMVDPVLSNQYPTSTPCWILVETYSGFQLSIDLPSAKGHADNPLSELDMIYKFRKITTPNMDISFSNLFIDDLQHIENISNIRSVLNIIPNLQKYSTDTLIPGKIK